MNKVISQWQFNRIVEMYSDVMALYDEAVAYMRINPNQFTKREFGFIESIYELTNKIFHECSKTNENVYVNDIISIIHKVILNIVQYRNLYNKTNYTYRTLNSFYDVFDEAFTNIIKDI